MFTVHARYHIHLLTSHHKHHNTTSPQEKWSIGLEWELIEYVLDVYLMLVVGEGRHPVSTGAGSGYPGSNNNNSAGDNLLTIVVNML